VTDKNYDPFFYNKIFPNASNLFGAEFKSIDQIKENSLVFLDTNVLLLPYTVGKSSLEEIHKIYGELAQKKRIIIPGQVAREFAKNRPTKLTELHKQLLDKKSKLSDFQIGNYPLIKGLDEYSELNRVEVAIKELMKEYNAQIEKIIERITSWHWNDPVSMIYKEYFTETVVQDIQLDDKKEKELITELEYRRLHKIPPGYKDGSKDDGGIGDLLIWKTILMVAKEKNKDALFVTGDVKADWWHGSNKQNIYPRYELIDEFIRETEGKTIHIIEFSSLLDLLGVESRIVDEIKSEETKQKKGYGYLPYKRVDGNLYNFIEPITRKSYIENSMGLKRQSANKEYMVDAAFLIKWFLERYMDPANGVPHDVDGNYIYVNGGPYDPIKVILKNFPDAAEVEIKQAADYLFQDGNHWVKREDY
jgi:hypothetical protein